MINSDGLIKSLKEVPEQRLKLLDLARESVKEDGTLNMDALAFRNKEVGEAADEAEAYVNEVQEMVSRLAQLMGK